MDDNKDGLQGSKENKGNEPAAPTREEGNFAGGYTFSSTDGWQKAPENHRDKKWRKSLLIVGLVLIFLAIIIGTITFILSNQEGNTNRKTGAIKNSYKLPKSDYVAVLYVKGVIADIKESPFGMAIEYNHQWTLEQFDELMKDENNKAILLYVNSPGGGVYESDELYVKIREYKENTGNPVLVYMGGMAASGGYYISAPADQIYANRNTWTGSIGVTLGNLFDISELLNKHGIKSKTITSGANKAMGNNVEPMTEEQEAIFQSLVDEAYDQFTGIIAEGRKLPIGDVKKLADGRIYTAAQALKLKLIDQISTYDEAVEDIKKKYNLEDAEITSVEYLPQGNFLDKFLQGNILRDLKSLLPIGQGELGSAIELMKGNKLTPQYIFQW